MAEDARHLVEVGCAAVAMAQNFSGSLKIMDLDDFIAPAQACIVPLAGNQSGAEDSSGGGFKLDIGGPAMIAPTEQLEMKNAPAIQVSLPLTFCVCLSLFFDTSLASF